MTKEELAARLNGREYGAEITKAEEADAARSGLVVVFGYSDDNVEFRGAINEEVGWYEGGDSIVLLDGALFEDDSCECRLAQKARDHAYAKGHDIQPVWGKGGYSWTYETDIPHATFEVVEDGQKFCRGIVFEATATKARS